MIGARRWALDGEERTWARGEVSPGSGHARADANLRRPGGVTRERERAVLPDQRQYGKTALQWCPASLRTLPAFSWKPHYRGRAARIAFTASSVLSPVAYTPDVHVTCQIYLSWRTTYYTPVHRVATGYHTSTTQCKPSSNQQDKYWTNWLPDLHSADNQPVSAGSVRYVR